jgi:hypothetical protein
LVGIICCATAVDGSQVRQVLVFGKGQSDFVENTVKLGVAFDSEERHQLYFYYNNEKQNKLLKLRKILKTLRSMINYAHAFFMSCCIYKNLTLA